MKTAEQKEHLKRVAQIPCIICNNPYVEVHHITGVSGLGAKASDFETIPLCAEHHRLGDRGVAVHSGVKSFEDKYGTQLHLLEKTRMLLKQQEQLTIGYLDG
jgi:hypothetical protein